MHTKKCAMKMKETNKETRKNDARVKMFLMEGGHLYGDYVKMVSLIAKNLKSMIVDTMKVLFV